ncbi:hypothetical protein BGW37DRAFT_501298 [Umbelopsis sp. PMI_123]|nr:hypothetical protein BGW37DRAFT_501298 [Umbelopsis sp. PMI_123]
MEKVIVNYPCLKCSKQYSIRQKLVAHYLTAHGTTVEGTTRRRTTNDKYMYVKENADAIHFGCIWCLEHFVTKDILLEHCSESHPGEDKAVKRQRLDPDSPSPDAIEDIHDSLYEVVGDSPVDETDNVLWSAESPTPHHINIHYDNAGQPPRASSRWIVDDIDISMLFHKFKKNAVADRLDGTKLFLESHIEEILSQSHIMLLKPSQHCELAIDVYGGVDNLKRMHATAKANLMRDGIEFNRQIAFDLQILVMDLQNGKCTRHATIRKLHNIMSNDDHSNMTLSILWAVHNLVCVLPSTTLLEPVGEMELCVAYVDSILRPLISDPDRDVLLRWPNKQAPESRLRKSSRAKQPDAIVSHVKQLNYDCSLGHGEVKAEEYTNDKYCLSVDLIKLATFNKDAIDERHLNSCLAFQVVGHHMTVYITKLLAEGLYAMTEITTLSIPKSIQELDTLVTMTTLTKLMEIGTIFWQNCKQSNDSTFFESNRRPTFASPDFKAIVNSTRDRRRPSRILF